MPRGLVILTPGLRVVTLEPKIELYCHITATVFASEHDVQEAAAKIDLEKLHREVTEKLLQRLSTVCVNMSDMEVMPYGMEICLRKGAWSLRLPERLVDPSTWRLARLKQEIETRLRSSKPTPYDKIELYIMARCADVASIGLISKEHNLSENRLSLLTIARTIVDPRKLGDLYRDLVEKVEKLVWTIKRTFGLVVPIRRVLKLTPVELELDDGTVVTLEFIPGRHEESRELLEVYREVERVVEEIKHRCDVFRDDVEKIGRTFAAVLEELFGGPVEVILKHECISS